MNVRFRHVAVLMSVVFFAAVNPLQAQLFQQDFSTSSTVSDYVSAAPNSGQWNAISSSGSGTIITIANGALRFDRLGNAGSFSRTTDLAGPPTALMYKFDLAVPGLPTAATTAAFWEVGTGFGTANGAEPNASVHSRFALNFTSSAGQITLRNLGSGTNSISLAATQTIVWVINNTGASLTYLAPDNSQESLPNDAADVWAGTIKALNDVQATTGTQPLTDLKFVFSAGNGVITMDNFSITTVPTGVAAPVVTFGPIMTNDVLAVRYLGSPNTTYTLEGATEMPAASWQKLQNATSDANGEFELTTPTAGFPSRYVRTVYPSY